MDERESEVRVRFWGVRGSVPSPGTSTVRYGGNTPCVSIQGTNAADGIERIGILDAGTGIRQLGHHLAETDTEIILLVTHNHWDHIQGFPFFAPLYQPDRIIYLTRFERRHGLFRLLLEQMDGTRFPLTHDEIQSKLASYPDGWVQEQKRLGYKLQRIRVNHPGVTFGVRVQLRGVTIIYIPDNEIVPPDKPRVSFEQLAAFCRGADVLIHDAMFLEADMPCKQGWGHSVVSQTLELGLAANVKHLVLFHHDPDRSDDALDAIQADATRFFAARNPQIRCTVAYEGLELTLKSPDDSL